MKDSEVHESIEECRSDIDIDSTDEEMENKQRSDNITQISFDPRFINRILFYEDTCTLNKIKKIAQFLAHKSNNSELLKPL